MTAHVEIQKSTEILNLFVLFVIPICIYLAIYINISAPDRAIASCAR